MAKRVIGELTTRVTANSAQFAKGMRTAKAEAKGFAAYASRSISGAGSAIAGSLKNMAVAAGVAVAATGAALGVMVVHTFDAVDKLAKTADSIGITTQALGQLQHAAGLAGVDNDLLTASLVRMTRVIGEAKLGSKGAATTLDRLGLSAERLAQMTPDNQIKAIADQLEKVEDPATRAALAMEVFGKQGAKMVNVLAGGSDALAATAAEADKLGITISRIDAAKIEIANDSITRLRAVIQGVVNQVAIALAPWVAELAKRLTAAGTAGGGMGQTIVSALKWIAMGAAKVVDVIDLIKIAWVGVKWAGIKAVEGLLFPVEKLVESIDGLIHMVEDYLPAAFVKAADDAVDSIRGIRSGLDQMAQEQGKAIDDILLAPSASEKLDQFFRDADRNIEAEAKAIADASDAKRKAQVEYNASVLDGLKLQGAESNLKKSEKKKSVHREDLKLLITGTADAQNFVIGQVLGQQKTIDEDILKEEKTQSDLLRDVADNTADDDFVPVNL